ncbi:unnamed protein product [Cyprideis torosa]|uniref:XK-related protein n=1 Tax=Cyprideis torosa TaxID=163714 RepID=A0A7R8ZMQ4_9CRUS|nr:unnamed protein product [Cyprideis torosa]CAG0884967.1 unnamed protein product [Cyprideis torosa]
MAGPEETDPRGKTSGRTIVQAHELQIVSAGIDDQADIARLETSVISFQGQWNGKPLQTWQFLEEGVHVAGSIGKMTGRHVIHGIQTVTEGVGKVGQFTGQKVVKTLFEADFEGDFDWWAAVQILISIASFIFDYVSDISVTILLWRENGNTWEFKLTQIGSLYFGYQSRKEAKARQRRVVGPYCVNPKREITYSDLYAIEQKNTAYLDLLHSMVEDAPQLVLQLYILLTQASLNRDNRTTFCTGPDNVPHPIQELLYNAVMAWVLIVDFMNLTSQPTRFKLLLYYGIVLVENATLGALFHIIGNCPCAKKLQVQEKLLPDIPRPYRKKELVRDVDELR